jgi:general secretion pathway protein B
MSFILDALKKAESERSRNSGPVLMDVRIAPSRQRLPLWAWILGCVLLANLAGVAWLLLRKPPAPAPGAVAIVAPPGPAAPTPEMPAPAPTLPAATPQPAVIEPVLVQPPAAAVPLPTALLPPVVKPQPAPVTPRITPPRTDNLPTLQDLIAQGVSLPALQLNLHVYDEAPASRFVLLNSQRLREGDEVADGVRVESIVPRGVVLSARGRRFILLAGA